jgi:hypothetical protein
MRNRFMLWVVLALTVSMTGCCRWCQRHCCQPAQPVSYAPAPAAYAPAPACCAPAAPPPVCCQPAAPVCQPAPVCCPSGYTPQPAGWARQYAPQQPGGVCCQ